MSKEGIELAEALITKFKGPLNAGKATGLNESTLEKWRIGVRSPRYSNYLKGLIALQFDDPIKREARILLYTKQITESGRILWKNNLL